MNAPKISPKFFLFVAILVIASLACVKFQSPVVWETEVPQVSTESTADVATYKVEKNHAWVYASDGSLFAEVTAPQGVDLPSEWLKDREGVHYLFQSGIDRKVELTVTLYKGAAFAIDGDWMLYGGTNLGTIDNSADFRAFADTPGEYRFTASSFGLAIGPFRSDGDKAGFVLADRRNADGNDGRPEYWLNLDGSAVQIGQ